MLFLNCAHCSKTLPKGVSMRSHARLEVGLDHNGLLVSCVRCGKEVARFDPFALEQFMVRVASGECECAQCVAERKARALVTDGTH